MAAAPMLTVIDPPLRVVHVACPHARHGMTNRRITSIRAVSCVDCTGRYRYLQL